MSKGKGKEHRKAKKIEKAKDQEVKKENTKK